MKSSNHFASLFLCSGGRVNIHVFALKKEGVIFLPAMNLEEKDNAGQILQQLIALVGLPESIIKKENIFDFYCEDKQAQFSVLVVKTISKREVIKIMDSKKTENIEGVWVSYSQQKTESWATELVCLSAHALHYACDITAVKEYFYGKSDT